MNKKDILRMARETQPENEDMFIRFVYANMTDELCAFARLIAEDCAKRCEAIADEYQRAESLTFAELKTDAQTGAQDCVAAIREAYKP